MNDDLGNFPTPKSTTPPASPTPAGNSGPSTSTPSSTSYTPPAFEPTPDEIPSFATQKAEPTPEESADSLLTAKPADSAESTPVEDFFPEVKSSPTNLNSEDVVEEPPVTATTEALPRSVGESPTTIPSITPPTGPILATTPPSTKSSAPSLIAIILLLIAGVGISGSVFLYSQSASLKKQLTDITKTLEQQKTIITPSPTPTLIDIPSPTLTPEPTEEVIISPSPTATPSPTVVLSNNLIPLALAPQALKVGINHEPNAQLILIKAENAQDPSKALIKYFFRKDLTTKKYFYVSINGKNESEINDNAIYVNPDNSIPSLNDLVLGNKLGIDFKEAHTIATKLCTTDCSDLSVNAQFIKSGANTIWQITLDPTDKKHIIQINSQTKQVLFKSPNI